MPCVHCDPGRPTCVSHIVSVCLYWFFGVRGIPLQHTNMYFN